MTKYLVDASVFLSVEDLEVYLEESDMLGDFKEELTDLVVRLLRKRLKLLDIKGGLSGDRGFIGEIDVDCVTNWISQD